MLAKDQILHDLRVYQSTLDKGTSTSEAVNKLIALLPNGTLQGVPDIVKAWTALQISNESNLRYHASDNLGSFIYDNTKFRVIELNKKFYLECIDYSSGVRVPSGVKTKMHMFDNFGFDDMPFLKDMPAEHIIEVLNRLQKKYYRPSVVEFIDLATWISYDSVIDKEIVSTQLENQIDLGINDICFVPTLRLKHLDDWLKNVDRLIPIESTEVALSDEVFYTCKIEGAQTTRKRTQEIHDGAKVDPNNRYSESMLAGSFSAVKYLNLYGNKLDHSSIRDVWEVMVKDCCDNADIAGIQYRSGDVRIGAYNPPTEKELLALMTEWLNVYADNYLVEYPFIKAAALHFAFENIHPFCDGNGRLGRLLLNNFLIYNNIESAKAVSFSMLIDRHRIEYDAAFAKSENTYNDCTPFIEFMLQVMTEAYSVVLQERGFSIT